MSAKAGYCSVTLGALWYAAVFSASPVEAASPSVRVYANDSCIIADEPVVAEGIEATKALGWAGVVVGNTTQAMIGDIVRAFASALRFLAAPKETTYLASSEFYLYQVDYSISARPTISPFFGCVTVVAGEFNAIGSDCMGEYEPARIEEDQISNDSISRIRAGRSARNVLRRANICLVDEPDYVFENRLEYSEDSTAFRLRSAGYQVNRLLSTKRTNAERAILKTVSLFAPSADGRGEHLASSWINYGKLKSGDFERSDSDLNVSGWTRLPRMSAAATQSYQAQSHYISEAEETIRETESAILRRLRQIRSIEHQIASGDSDLNRGLRPEVDRLKVRLAIDSAALDAVKAEFNDMPKDVRRFMPVSLQVRVTESKSEARLLTWLADFLEANSYQIAESIADGPLRN